MTPRLSRRVVVISLTTWIVAVSLGMLLLSKYSSTPGEQAASPEMWPVRSTLARRAGVPTLVMMSHPRCPCTRASIVELEALVSEFPDNLTVYVLFVQPDGTEDAWANSALWRSASRIPGVHVIRDKKGDEANGFAGLTSGTVVLYDGQGRLRFHGGITGARGHIGDNFGRQRVIALLKGEEPDRSDSPVFGCPLHNPE